VRVIEKDFGLEVDADSEEGVERESKECSLSGVVDVRGPLDTGRLAAASLSSIATAEDVG